MTKCHRGGHTKASPGASALLDELTEDRILDTKVATLLAQYDRMVSMQPPENVPYPAELSYGIRVANATKADLSYSIHLNKAFNSYDGALGVEIVLYSDEEPVASIARRILANMERLGFKNRGIKINKGLGELNSISGPSMIIEVCFVEATKDVEVYRTVGTDKIAHAIANGIDPRVPLNANSYLQDAPVNKPNMPIIEYCGHVQSIGWMSNVVDGAECGTTGQSRRLEALLVKYFGPGKILGEVHVQNYGWTTIRTNGEILGTVGLSLRTEAFKFRLEGAPGYHIEYRVHVQGIGWKDWVRDGAVAGTTGQSRRVEAIQIKIVKD